MQKDVYIGFVDFEKAFDRVSHDRLIEILEGVGIDQADIIIISNLYWNQQATVKINGESTRSFEVKRGVRQGCVLSPILYNIYSEIMMRDVLNSDIGIKVNGEIISSCRYADDTALLAESEVGLQRVIDKLDRVGINYGLRINTKKTKVMVMSKAKVGPKINITIRGEALQQVSDFSYLGSLISSDGRCEKEVKKRIVLAKQAFVNLKEFFKSGVNLSLKKRLLECYVWSVVLYGSETWTLSKAMQARLGSFEMWCYRRILKISYKEHISNATVLSRIKSKSKLLKIHKQRKFKYFGHMIRAEGRLSVVCMGKIEGKRARGRQRLSWMDEVTNMAGSRDLRELLSKAKDRWRWRAMASNPQNWGRNPD